MKHVNQFTKLLSLCLLVLFSACEDKVESTMVYSHFEPVYISKSELRSSVTVEAPRENAENGKIYIYLNYLFLNEPDEGFHVYDNSNPANPKKLSFVKLPGNRDVSVRNDKLYADSYMDLVVFDIADPANPQLENRYEDVFQYVVDWNFDPEKGLIVDYQLIENVVVSNKEFDGTFPEYFYQGSGLFTMEDDLSALAEFNEVSNVAGMGGSMARFTIVDDFLYAIDHESIYTFDLTLEEEDILVSSSRLEWGIETIFPYQGHLYIGANDGMHILGLENPNQPVHISTFEHVRACDPVVVKGDLAFVTLRDGNTCWTTGNELQIVDVSNKRQPTLLMTYPMDNPHGLGIDGDLLFICEGDFGLKIYDIEDIDNIEENLLAKYSEIHAFDVIPYNNNLILTGKDGLHQFDYSNPQDIRLLSDLGAAF